MDVGEIIKSKQFQGSVLLYRIYTTNVSFKRAQIDHI